MTCYVYERTGQVIANFFEETYVLKVEEKSDNVDAGAQWNMNEWIIMWRSEKRTNENFPSEMLRLPESGLQRRTASRENPDFSYRTIESARKYVNKLSYARACTGKP